MATRHSYDAEMEARVIGKLYVRLWRAEELIGINRGYNVAEFFPDMFFIGNGAGEAYAFVSVTDDALFDVPFTGHQALRG
jgi:hypothetical protein